jgi:DNA gyrase inhibitor GyrI
LFFEEPQSEKSFKELNMSDLQVKVANLEAMRVVCFNGFGESPEGLALEKLLAWARSHDQHGRVFGYNNPDPAAGSPNYGYDVWMQVDKAMQPVEGARLIDFPGGLYGVARVHVSQPEQQIPEAWQALVKWMEDNDYQHGSHQWLEEHLDVENALGGENFVLDLYLPIKK